MPVILPTAQNMALLLYVHHRIAKLVRMYPNSPSNGSAMPTNDVRTRGRRQYPRTDAERQMVRVAEKWPPCADAASCCCADASAGERGGDMSDRIQWSEMLPNAASP